MILKKENYDIHVYCKYIAIVYLILISRPWNWAAGIYNRYYRRGQQCTNFFNDRKSIQSNNVLDCQDSIFTKCRFSMAWTNTVSEVIINKSRNNCSYTLFLFGKKLQTPFSAYKVIIIAMPHLHRTYQCT